MFSIWHRLRHYKPIGKGSFGVVYGPFSKKTVTSILPAPATVDLPPKKFILKIIDTASATECKQHVLRNRRLISFMTTQIPESVRRHFIVPVQSLCIDQRNIIEIQPYGGCDFFPIVHPRGDAKPLPRDVYLHCLRSLLGAMDACLLLVWKYHLFVTDIKIENMTMHPNGRISIIDFDLVKLSAMPASMITTSYEQCSPIQLAHLLSQRRSQSFRAHYLERIPPQRRSVTIRNFLQSKRIPKQTIAAFAIVWVFAHIFSTLLRDTIWKQRFDRLVLTPMTTERLRIDPAEYTQSIHQIIDGYIHPIKSN